MQDVGTDVIQRFRDPEGETAQDAWLHNYLKNTSSGYRTCSSDSLREQMRQDLREALEGPQG